ncbi:hypothetical protein BLOT_008437 [Blomia tropicalis]|nr:hypothetical protein BLOT_008437 [Blomia tropicalis]
MFSMNRRTSTLLIVAMMALQLVLISDNLKPVSGGKMKKLKKIGALLLLLKTKKPKIGILPIPLPLPLPLKIEKPEQPIYIHKKSYPVPLANCPWNEAKTLRTILIGNNGCLSFPVYWCTCSKVQQSATIFDRMDR